MRINQALGVCATTPTQTVLFWFCLQVFHQAGPPQRVDCLALSNVDTTTHCVLPSAELSPPYNRAKNNFLRSQVDFRLRFYCVLIRSCRLICKQFFLYLIIYFCITGTCDITFDAIFDWVRSSRRDDGSITWRYNTYFFRRTWYWMYQNRCVMEALQACLLRYIYCVYPCSIRILQQISTPDS